MSKHVVVKVSGEAMGSGVRPLDRSKIGSLVLQISRLCNVERGMRIAVVIGGGNFIRGREAKDIGISQEVADIAGMMGSLANAKVLADSLKEQGREALVFSRFEATSALVLNYQSLLDLWVTQSPGYSIAILGGGTGVGGVSTDTAAAQLAVDIDADLLIKATNVRGVFSSDPKKPQVTTDRSMPEFFPSLSHAEMIERGLGVMDLGAVELCLRRAIDIRVCDQGYDVNALALAWHGEIGTIIHTDPVGELRVHTCV